MKFSDKIMTTKGLCEFIVGFCLPLGAGLAQWATGGDKPGIIAWIVILSAAVSGAFGKLGSFLSTSFSSYMDSNAIEKGNPPPSVTEVQQQVAANAPDKTKETV